MEFKFFIVISILFYSLHSIYAQNSPEFEGITRSKLEELTIRHLKSFQMSLERITSEDLAQPQKEKEIAICRKLFSADAVIETKSLNNYKKEWNVAEYLRSVAYPPIGTDIDISFLRDPIITNVERITGKTYKITGSLYQWFRKEKNTGKVYEDFTIKSAIVKIEQTTENNAILYQIKIIRINADQVSK